MSDNAVMCFRACPSGRVAQCAVALGVALALSLGPMAGAQDTYTVNITKLLQQRSNIDAELNALCNRICAGNESRGWLDHALLHLRPTAPASEIEAHVRLRSRHVPMKGIVAYDDTAHLLVRADVDNQTCEVSNVRLTSNNDIYTVLIAVFRPQLEAMTRDLKPPCTGQQ